MKSTHSHQKRKMTHIGDMEREFHTFDIDDDQNFCSERVQIELNIVKHICVNCKKLQNIDGV